MRSLILAMALVLVGGCSKPPDHRTVIHISSWGDIQENTILQGLITKFEKDNPGIHVALDRVPYEEYVDKLLTQFAGDLAPDIIFVSAENLADFYPRGLLEPLTPYVRKDPAFDLKGFYPELVKWYTVDGDLYVVPRDIAPVCVIYYNKKAFDGAGLAYPKDDWTVDEFMKDAQALTERDKNGNVLRWGFADDWALPEAWIYAFGGGFVDDTHHPTRYRVNEPGFVRGVQFRGDLINKYKVMPSPSSLAQQGSVGASDLFANGTAGMFLSGIWKTPLFRGIKDFGWDVAMFPHPKGMKGRVVGGSSGYGIVSSSKHKQEAWRFIAYLSGPEGQARFASTGLAQPALKKVAESSAFLDGKDPLNKKMLLKAVPLGVDQPMAVNWREVMQSIIFPRLDRVWLGKEKAVQAVAALNEELKKHPPVPMKAKNNP
ncbi:MAG TPA: sugar ABC transporter substrate-binding protein [bacterium]|nr:sugar ABC transporter substrate-binding protein [bacterium]